MRKLTIGLGVAAVVVIGAQGLLGQSDDTPFHVRGDRGELVHVLPPPALVHNNSDRNAVYAPPSDTVAVFSASYGSGNLIDHGGLEIGGAKVQPVFWNATVATDTAVSLGYHTIQGQIDAFGTRYGQNLGNYPGTDPNQSDFSIVQQYGSTSPIGAGFTALASYVDTSASHAGWPTTATVSDTDIQTYLESLFKASQLTADQTVVYGVYFPNGTQVTLSNSASCTSFCGYHNHFTYTNGTTSYEIKYAAFPYLNCSGCSLSPLTVADMLTIVSSHEIRESVTDPGDNNMNAWYDRVGYEADDKCAWHNLYTMTNGGFWVQPEYSNGGTVLRANFNQAIAFPGPGCVVPNSSGPPPRKHGK